MKPWQQYLFHHFRQEEYVEIPENLRGRSGLWRHATWEAFVYDTMTCWGTQMASLLSLVYLPKVIVEFGLDSGLTTLQFCRMNPQATVYGVDIHSRNPVSDLPIAYHALMNEVNNLTLILGRPSWDFAFPGQVDLCFIDACHTGDAPWKDTLRAWENRNAKGDWCIAWDDYHPNNPDVTRAVDTFCAEYDQEKHQVGSWFYIGNQPHDRLAGYGCTT